MRRIATLLFTRCHRGPDRRRPVAARQPRRRSSGRPSRSTRRPAVAAELHQPPSRGPDLVAAADGNRQFHGRRPGPTRRSRSCTRRSACRRRGRHPGRDAAGGPAPPCRARRAVQRRRPRRDADRTLNRDLVYPSAGGRDRAHVDGGPRRHGGCRCASNGAIHVIDHANRSGRVICDRPQPWGRGTTDQPCSGPAGPGFNRGTDPAG